MEFFMKKIVKRIRVLIGGLKSEEGFSLIELMIVIVIIGILAAIVVPRFMDVPQKARIQSTKQQIAALGMALDRYYLDNGTYPTSEQGLEALVSQPSSEPVPMNYNEGGYLKKKKIPVDPWGRSYLFVSPGEHGNDYEITSYGSDGKEGGDGVNSDIKSWE